MQNLRRHDERFDWRLNLLAVAMCMQDLCGFPQRLRHGATTGPALFLAGADSAYVQADSHAGIARLFPRARLEHIDDAGHWVHADQPGALLRTLRCWLHGMKPAHRAQRCRRRREPVGMATRVCPPDARRHSGDAGRDAQRELAQACLDNALALIESVLNDREDENAAAGEARPSASASPRRMCCSARPGS